jgi:hypothetical protein
VSASFRSVGIATRYGPDCPGFESVPIPGAERSKARICVRSLAGIAGSHPAGGMDVCVACVFCAVRTKDKSQDNLDKEIRVKYREQKKKKFTVDARFSLLVHTGSGTHPFSYTMGTGFPFRCGGGYFCCFLLHNSYFLCFESCFWISVCFPAIWIVFVLIVQCVHVCFILRKKKKRTFSAVVTAPKRVKQNRTFCVAPFTVNRACCTLFRLLSHCFVHVGSCPTSSVISFALFDKARYFE